MAINDDEARAQLITEMGTNPVLAHATLFGQAHQHETPAFHRQIIRDWHSDTPNILTMAFRGAAKSTLAEEAIVLSAFLERTKNCVILGESEERAVERLRTIKHIIETNEYAQAIFSVGPGDIWTEAKVTLSNGVILQALGRGQSLRGVKHLNSRPDLIFMDDLETKESVATPEARDKTLIWFTSTVMPALAPGGRMRMAATPLHPNALAPTLARKATVSWLTRTYPIVYKDRLGSDVATWPDRYSVKDARTMQAAMVEIGKGEEFAQEYMCEASNPALQVFTPDMIRVVPRVRSWHAVYAMYDPARTTNVKSATTGKAVWSWIGRKLVIWSASARKWLPNEIVEDMFNVERDYNPVAIGVEETGLNEWLLQPIRTEQVQRGIVLPLRALNAPKGKLDFIRGLQPYFRAGEVEFACDLPELSAQLLGFPTGAIDAPNALAYCLRMQLGQPVYDGFDAQHVAADLAPSPRQPLWLAVNSDGRIVTAALCQLRNGQLRVLADWLEDGDPGTVLPDIVMSASLDVPASLGPGAQPLGKTERLPGLSPRTALRLVSPPRHFEPYDHIGLRAAARRIPVDVQRGGAPLEGREELRQLFRRSTHGDPALVVSPNARWTLRALAGGYARNAGEDQPQANAYAVLMEGLETFAALFRGVGVQDDSDRNIAYTPSGKAYTSARAT